MMYSMPFRLGFRRVAVVERALGEVLVDLLAEVVRLELVLRIVLHRMESDEVNVEGIGRRIAFHGGRTHLEHVGLGALRPARDLDRGAGSTGAGAAGQREARQKRYRETWDPWVTPRRYTPSAGCGDAAARMNESLTGAPGSRNAAAIW